MNRRPATQRGPVRASTWISSWSTTGMGCAPGFCNRMDERSFLDKASAHRFSTPGMCSASTITWCLAIKKKVLCIKYIAFSHLLVPELIIATTAALSQWHRTDPPLQFFLPIKPEPLPQEGVLSKFYVPLSTL